MVGYGVGMVISRAVGCVWDRYGYSLGCWLDMGLVWLYLGRMLVFGIGMVISRAVGCVWDSYSYIYGGWLCLG